MKLYIITPSPSGNDTAQKVAQALQPRYKVAFASLADTATLWPSAAAFVFIGAMGICVRTIAPLLHNKHTDPAVVCIDAMGRNVIPVVSGHVGGANALAHLLANALNSHAAITTLSDNLGLWPLDTLAPRFGWTAAQQDMNAQIALFTALQPTALLLTIRDEGTEWLENNLPPHVTVFYRLDDIPLANYKLLIAVSPTVPFVPPSSASPASPQALTTQAPTSAPPSAPPIPYILYIPRCLHIGIGLARQAQPVAAIRSELFVALAANGIPEAAIRCFATIDLKASEPVVHALQTDQWPVRFFTAEDLANVPVPTPSATVMRHVGTPSVSEAAAIKSASAPLLLKKTKGPQWTLAAALDAAYIRRGHVEFVGAGPGDPELISVRGRRMLRRADLIVYAGSLVPLALVQRHARRGARIESSAALSLEQQIALISDYYRRGAFIVRLHTGDPCLYGAIQEQMNKLDAAHITYHITPGISAFQAAAAELRSQFTIPRRVQSIILTRGEGRTPMPPREKLHLLARSRATMCIYLSADVVEKVYEELHQEYPDTTPVAVCYRLTWPEQRIWRGCLSNLVALVRSNGLTLDTLLVIGDAIDNRQGLSELYSSHFSHLFRKADSDLDSSPDSDLDNNNTP